MCCGSMAASGVVRQRGGSALIARGAAARRLCTDSAWCSKGGEHHPIYNEQLSDILMGIKSEHISWDSFTHVLWWWWLGSAICICLIFETEPVGELPVILTRRKPRKALHCICLMVLLCHEL
jgi:hypothetical protein